VKAITTFDGELYKVSYCDDLIEATWLVPTMTGDDQVDGR